MYGVEAQRSHADAQPAGKLNAYTAQMGAELEDAFIRADEDDDIRVVVVTGAGRGFCAGADISGGRRQLRYGGQRRQSVRRRCARERCAPIRCGLRRRDLQLPQAFHRRDQRTGRRRRHHADIADGYSYRVRHRRSSALSSRGEGLCRKQARRGFCRASSDQPGDALVPVRQMFDAQEALRGGLVTDVVEPDRCCRAPRKSRARSPTKQHRSPSRSRGRLLWRFSGDNDPWGVLKVDAPLNIELGAAGDVKEGVSAFLEKRKPKFPGKVSTDMPAHYPWWNRMKEHDWQTIADIPPHLRAYAGRTRSPSPSKAATRRSSRFDRHTNQVANALIASGVKKGERICYLGKNSDHYFELFLGAAKMGAVMTPIGWRLAPPEIAYIVNDSARADVLRRPGIHRRGEGSSGRSAASQADHRHGRRRARVADLRNLARRRSRCAARTSR